MKLGLRKSQPGDLPFLKEMLYEAVFWRDGDEKPAFEEGLALPEVSKSLAGWGARDGDTAVVALVDSVRAGAAWYRYWSDDDFINGYFEEDTPVLVIALRLGYRHQGIGGKMIEWLVEEAFLNDVPKISLSVSKDNYALNLYKQQGFVVAAESRHAYVMVRKL